ncbi:MAG: adenylate/guanylate cyclase domain-containing protein [Sneathiellales bacterium]|nr:adenylate/guanylate cyclase domain-containing protein [Sneathiellales bacterium]
MAELSMSAPRQAAPGIFQEEDLESNRFLDEALAENKREGLKLAIKARFVALSIVALFMIYLVQDISVLYYEALVFAFMLNGWVQMKVGRVGKSRLELFLIFVDLALMTIVLVVPNPLHTEEWTYAMQYKYGNFPYFYILLAGATLAYSWRTLFAFAVWTSAMWMGAYFFAIYQPDPLSPLSEQIHQIAGTHRHLMELLDPSYIPLEGRIQEVLIFTLVAGILALNSWRSKHLLIRQANAARERANLARHFAPTIVDHLAGRDQPLGDVRSQSVVVMFVDIVGFTKMAEQQSPEKVVALLREFHSRMETSVFDNHGTLDKFLGDGLMVTFGTPETSADDAKNALRCALAMQQTMEEWNEVRNHMKLPPITLSVGLHLGNVILGDIGSERRLEYAVLGDTVNVASRLEALSRPLNASIVASDDVVKAAGGAREVEKNGFKDAGPQDIRGREETVHVWLKDR